MENYAKILENKLKGKRILFIGAKFYYYNEEIIKKMVGHGAQVSFFYERDVSLKYGLAKNIFPKYADRLQENHYNHILSATENKTFDFLFVIRGYRMENWFIEHLKLKSPHLRTIMYQWDSIYNWECDYRHMIPWFDITKTFDYKDAKDLKIEYVPTFHTDEFMNLPDVKPGYELFFFGGYSQTRYDFTKRLVEYCLKHKITVRTHLAISIKFYLKELISGRKLESRFLKFNTLNKNQYISAFNKANIVIDYTNPAQTGVTMRCLDTLGAGKKLLTSNEYIKKEPGYTTSQIRIFDPKNLKIDTDFLTPEQFPKQNYSIERWLCSIFTLNSSPEKIDSQYDI
jgi:hypothetical protein